MARGRLAPRIRERIRREFFPEDYAAAFDQLEQWRTRPYAPGETPSRMHAAVLNLARGRLPDLARAIADAESDFRDVLLWGETKDFEYLRCVECEPGVTTDPAEEAFLTGIRAKPTDNTTRLVYADWLEERGDSRAEYLRVLCEWLTGPRVDDWRLIDRERELRAGLPTGWLARIRGIPVREKKRRKRTS